MKKLSDILCYVFLIIGILAIAAAIGAVAYIIINLKTILALIAATWLIGGM